MLGRIFTHKSTTIVGFSFQSDLAQFRSNCPNMRFFENIPKLLDLQDLYKKAVPDFKDMGGFGLAAVCQTIMGNKLCKGE